MWHSLSLIWIVVLTAVLLPNYSGADEEVPDSGLSDELGARYEYVDYDCTISGNTLKMTYRSRLKVINKRGDSYARVSIWEDSHNRLKHALVTLYDASGQIVLQKSKKELRKSCGFAGGLMYDDACYYTGDFSASEYPYFVENEWHRDSKSLFYWRGAGVERYVPVDRFSYRASVPNDFGFRHYTSGIEMEPIVSNLDNGRTEYYWQAVMLPALDDIDYRPPACNQPARLVVIPDSFKLDKYEFSGNTWREIGLWYSQLYSDRYLPVPDSPVVSQDPKTTLRTIYDDLRRNIRYVAIEVGVGGWRPYKAELTQERGFGDCKGMSTLLVSRLRNAGIESYPVLVRTRGRGPIDTESPRVNFNHVISVALVDSDTIWMDPTCDGCPLGDLPRMDEAIDVVVNLTGGGEIWKTPASRPEDNRRERMTQIHVDSELNCKITCEMTVTGERGRYLRQKLRSISDDDTRAFVNRQFAGADILFKLDWYEFDSLSDDYQPVVLRIRAHSRRPLKKIGSRIYCSPFLFNRLSGMEKEPLDDRFCGINLFYPDQHLDRITVTWDSALQVESVVVPMDDSCAFASSEFTLSVSPFADSVRVNLRRASTAYEVPVEQFDRFVEYRDRLKNLLKQHIKLVTSSR